MSDLEDFVQLLNEIDTLLESYDPGQLDPDRAVGEIIKERANQRPILEKAIQAATKGLERYPYNSELLKRRAYARCRIVTPQGEYPEIERAEDDLRTILKFDPNNLDAALDLLENMFTFSGMEEKDIAEVSEELAVRTEKILLQYRGLQIRSLGYSDQHDKAEEIYSRWIKVFPDSEWLRKMKKDADSMKLP